MNKILTMLVALALLAGCGFMQDRPDTARGITMYATIKAAKGDPVRADKIERIARDVREYATGDKMLTVEILIEAVRQEARYDDMLPEDKILTDILLAELRNGLERRFGADVLPEDLRLAVDTVAEWVIEAAQLV